MGFQAHQIGVRFFLMDEDLSGLPAHPSQNDYVEAIEKAGHVRGTDEYKRHMQKLLVFMSSSLDTLHTHFSRWLSPKMLPMMLLSEPPMARIVAAVMRKEAMPSRDSFGELLIPDIFNERVAFKSDCHKRVVDLKRFDLFIRKIVDGDAEYTQENLRAAELVANGVDLRIKNYEGAVGAIRLDMHSTYLQLPSQTQFVESIVKEAKLVSQTDRSEQHRTWLAIIRSATPLGKTEKGWNVNKIKAIIQSTSDRVNPHYILRREEGYQLQYNRTLAALSREHYRAVRIGDKKVTVDDQGVKYKKPNVVQQIKQQHQTPTVSGLVPYGKLFLKKHDHMRGLEVELLHRGTLPANMPDKITGRKDLLKQLETQRLITEEGVDMKTAAEKAKKHFECCQHSSSSLIDAVELDVSCCCFLLLIALNFILILIPCHFRGTVNPFH